MRLNETVLGGGGRLDWIQYLDYAMTDFLKIISNSFIFLNPQEALNLLITDERCWALSYMPLYTQFTAWTGTDRK
jgi:hypothetical protein